MVAWTLQWLLQHDIVVTVSPFLWWQHHSTRFCVLAGDYPPVDELHTMSCHKLEMCIHPVTVLGARLDVKVMQARSARRAIRRCTVGTVWSSTVRA